MSDRAQRRPTEMDGRARLPTVSGRLPLHGKECISIGNDIMRHRTDSGFMSTSSILVGEPCGEYLERESRTGYTHNTNCQLNHTAVADGMGQPRYTMGAEGGSREMLARGREEATMHSCAKASHGYPEFNRPRASDDNGFNFGMRHPASRFSGESNSRRSFTSTPSLFIRDPERSESYAAAVSQADSPRFARSERNISRYAFGSERRGSDYSTFAEADDSDIIFRSESMDSALCLDNPCRPRTTSLHSTLYVSSNPILPLEAPEKDAGRVGRPVENDGHIQNATAVTPASHPTRVIPGVGTDRAVAPRGRAPPPDVLLIRRILGVASLCMPPPVSRKELGMNSAFSAETFIYDYGSSSADSRPISRLPPPVEMHPSPGDSGKMRGSHRPLPVDFTQYCSLEKDDFLKAFDMMCREARESGIDVVGRVIQISNFAAAMLDSRGGYLSIDALDVHLYVTPGAISEGRPELVYIFVQGNVDISNNSLTPSVHCGPSTLRFRKDVILTFPHCAVDAGNYRFTCVKSMSGGIHHEIREGKDGVVLVDTNSITVTMDHFCGYSACAPVHAKHMMVCVFINEDLELGKARIRVRLFDYSNANLQEVKKQEWRYRFSLADTVGQMVIHRTGRVLITLSPDGESWKVTEPESCQKTLQHSILWLDNSPDIVPAFPFALFFASCDSPRRLPFKARMKVIQKGEGNHGADFFVQVPRQHDCPTTNIASSVPCSSDGHIRQLFSDMMSQLNLTVPVRTEVMPIAEGIYLRLCDVLDTPLPIAGDWRSLPECLPGMEGFGGRWISNVETRAGRERRSPTGLILDTFFAISKASGKGQAHALWDLMQGLLSLGRRDVQFAIDAFEEQLGLNRVDRDEIEITAGPERDRDSNNNMGRSHPSITGFEGRGRQEQCGPSRGSTSAHQPPSNKVNLLVSDTMSEPDFKVQREGAWDSPRKDSAYSSFSTDIDVLRGL